MGSLIKLLHLSFSSYVVAVNLVSAVAAGVGYYCGCCCMGIVVIGNAIVVAVVALTQSVYGWIVEAGRGIDSGRWGKTYSLNLLVT